MRQRVGLVPNGVGSVRPPSGQIGHPEKGLPSAISNSTDQIRNVQSARRVRMGTMTFERLCDLVPKVLSEMTSEFVLKGGEYFDLDVNSQHTACFLLAIRSVSLLRGMEALLGPDTFDSWDVLMRAFMESRDLLLTFRFDDEGTRNHVRSWFKGKDSQAWKPKHKICERFLTQVGAVDSELARRWGLFSGLSHPTARAARNSAAITAARISNKSRPNLTIALEEKRADYLSSIATLFITASFELPGWIHLGCNTNRMPSAERFRIEARAAVLPILNRKECKS
jgi:hypothetical protein